MPVTGDGSRLGLTYRQASDGIQLAEIAGAGAGPDTLVIFAGVDGVKPEDCPTCSIQEFPGNKSAVGANAGSIAVIATLQNTGDDIHYDVAGGGVGQVIVPEGLWTKKVRSIVAAVNIDDVSCWFTIQYLNHDLDTYNSGPTETTTAPNKIDSHYDPEEEKGHDTIEFSYQNTGGENPTSFAIKRTKSGVSDIIGSIPRVVGQTNYEYTDYSITAPGPYVYSIIPYIQVGTFKAPESALGVNPDVATITDLSFAEDLESIIILMSDPSGIYTLIKDKTHDTLYERTGVTHIDVAIPDPFAKSSFVP